MSVSLSKSNEPATIPRSGIPNLAKTAAAFRLWILAELLRRGRVACCVVGVDAVIVILDIANPLSLLPMLLERDIPGELGLLSA